MRSSPARFPGALLAAAFALGLGIETASATHGPLVEVEWLRANLDRADVVVLDTRAAPQRGNPHLDGFVPGAVHAPYPGGWLATRDGIAGQLPALKALEAHVGGLGISGRETIVLVAAASDASELAGATRVYWTLMLVGVADIAILNGGWRAWLASESTPIARTPRTPAPAAFAARLRPELLASSEEGRARLGDHATVLLDARPLAQFAGRERSPHAPRAGRLPGARHLDHALLFDAASGRLLSPDAAQRLLPPELADPQVAIVSYCNTGHWASLNWFVLSQVLDYEKVAMFDDSMVGWGADPRNPIAADGAAHDDPDG